MSTPSQLTPEFVPVYYVVSSGQMVALGAPIAGGGGGSWGSITGTLSSQTDLNTALAAKSPGGATVTSAATSITVAAATHNGNVLATTAATAVALTLNTGAGLTAGMVVEQRGAGLVTLSGTATFVAPNGLSTSGVNTTMAIVPTEAADSYLVLVNRTSDQTLVNATSGATPAVNLALYNIVDLTLTANCTPAFSGAVSGQWFSVTLILRQDATGGRTLALPTTKWASGTGPTYTTTANAINVITLATVDGGSTFFGFLGGVGFA